MWQKIVGWLMLLMGVIFLLMMIPGIQQGALQKPGGASATMPLILFAFANGVLGFGVLKMQKWGLCGAIIFGILMILWYLSMGGFHDPFYSAGLIFYVIAVILLVPNAIKDFSKK